MMDSAQDHLYQPSEVYVKRPSEVIEEKHDIMMSIELIYIGCTNLTSKKEVPITSLWAWPSSSAPPPQALRHKALQ